MDADHPLSPVDCRSITGTRRSAVQLWPTQFWTGLSTIPTASFSQEKASDAGPMSRNRLTEPIKPNSMKSSASLPSSAIWLPSWRETRAEDHAKSDTKARDIRTLRVLGDQQTSDRRFYSCPISVGGGSSAVCGLFTEGRPKRRPEKLIRVSA